MRTNDDKWSQVGQTQFENVAITGHFGFVFEEHSYRETRYMVIVTSFLESVDGSPSLRNEAAFSNFFGVV